MPDFSIRDCNLVTKLIKGYQMKTEKEVNDFIANGYKTYYSNLVIDCAIFGYHEQQLKILLAKWKMLNGYSLPGGFVGRK